MFAMGRRHRIRVYRYDAFTTNFFAELQRLVLSLAVCGGGLHACGK